MQKQSKQWYAQYGWLVHSMDQTVGATTINQLNKIVAETFRPDWIKDETFERFMRSIENRRKRLTERQQ